MSKKTRNHLNVVLTVLICSIMIFQSAFIPCNDAYAQESDIQIGDPVTDTSDDYDDSSDEILQSDSEDSDDEQLIEDENLKSADVTTYDKSGYKSTEKPSKAKIVQKRKVAYDVSPEKRFTVEPSVENPYATGTLDSVFIESGTEYLNYIRYIAGLPDITTDDSLCENAQYGAVLLAAINTLTHNPSQPSDMDSDFYQKGSSATQSSNISSRWGSGYSKTQMIVSSIQGCMEDSSSVTNLTTVGHRRWFLNPSLGKVGFGCADSTSGTTYIVNKVFDRSATVQDYDFISWPASGYFPSDLASTNMPWSITLNPSKFKVNSTSLNYASITIKRVSDGKSWVIDSNSDITISSVSDGRKTYRQINTNGYGISNCIIFHINASDLGVSKFDGLYHVEVVNLKDISGNDVKLSYDVEFFDVSTVTTIEYNNEWINGFWYNSDGTQTYKATGAWIKDTKGWRYQDSYGWYPKNEWQKIDGKWYYFKSDGYMASKEWCNGYWLNEDGSWTYQTKAEWKRDSKGWWYQDSYGWYPKNEWQMIDEKWYYFKSDGYMASKEWCNGYWLNEDGSWTYQPKGSWKSNSVGWWYEDTSGWYAKNEWLTIDGKRYHFNDKGYWDK